MFEEGPLRAVIQAFGDNFEGTGLADPPDTPVRFLMTHHLPFFPAMTVYAMLVGDWVELVGIDVDADYFRRIAEDPDDL